jgi:hypothetical protein
MAGERTIGINTGDGYTVPQVIAMIGLPGPGSTTVVFEGNVKYPGIALQAISGSPLAGPVVPGAGSTFWIIQLADATGVATIKTSAGSVPLADAGNVVVYSDVLASTDGSISTSTTSITPDQW